MLNLNEIKNPNTNLVNSWLCCDYGHSSGHIDTCNRHIRLADILNFGDTGRVLYICQKLELVKNRDRFDFCSRSVDDNHKPLVIHCNNSNVAAQIQMMSKSKINSKTFSDTTCFLLVLLLLKLLILDMYTSSLCDNA